MDKQTMYELLESEVNWHNEYSKSHSYFKNFSYKIEIVEEGVTLIALYKNEKIANKTFYQSFDYKGLMLVIAIAFMDTTVEVVKSIGRGLA